MGRVAQSVGLALLLADAAVLAAAAPISATSGNVNEYPLPPNAGYCACPIDIVTGPDGNLWFTENGGAVGYGAIGRMTTSGSVTEFRLPTFNSSPVGITAGPAGTQNLWFTEQNTNRIGEITTGGMLTQFTLALAGSQPGGITLGPDGNLWFTQSLANTTTTTCTHHRCTTTTSTTTGYIGRITPAGLVTEFAIPIAYSRPVWITSGPDSNLWFTDQNTNSVGKMTTAGSVTEYSLPTAASQPSGITAGPDGNIWLTEENAGNIARVTIATGVVTEFPAVAAPARIVTGPDGNLWFTEYFTATAPSGIGTMSRAGSLLASYTNLSTNAGPQGITVGPSTDGRIWFTEEPVGAIGAITIS